MLYIFANKNLSLFKINSFFEIDSAEINFLRIS